MSFKQPPEISIGLEALNSSDLNKVTLRQFFCLFDNALIGATAVQWPGLGPFLRSSIVNAVGTMLVCYALPLLQTRIVANRSSQSSQSLQSSSSSSSSVRRRQVYPNKYVYELGEARTSETTTVGTYLESPLDVGWLGLVLVVFR